MNNDRDTERGEGMHQGNRGTRTMQRSRTEHGEIESSNPEIDDDAIVAEASRSDIGAGE